MTAKDETLYSFYANRFDRVAKCPSSHAGTGRPSVMTDGTALLEAWRLVFAQMAATGDWSFARHESFARLAAIKHRVPAGDLLEALRTFEAIKPPGRKPTCNVYYGTEIGGNFLRGKIDAVFLEQDELWVFTLKEPDHEAWINAEALAVLVNLQPKRSRKKKLTVFLVPITMTQDYWDVRSVNTEEAKARIELEMLAATTMVKKPTLDRTYRIGSHCAGCERFTTCYAHRDITKVVGALKLDATFDTVTPGALKDAHAALRMYERFAVEFRAWSKKYVKDRGGKIEDPQTGEVAVVTTAHRSAYTVNATTFDQLRFSTKGKEEEEKNEKDS
jgi:hypothetical protein